MEIAIAAFTGVGSLLIGLVAVRIQHLADTQVLLWPELIRSHEHGGENRYSVQIRTVVGPAIDVRFGLIFDDGSWGWGTMSLLDQGESWDVWPSDAGTAISRGESPAAVSDCLVWVQSRVSRLRWHAWLVSANDAGPDVRRTAAVWGTPPSTASQAFARFRLESGGSETDIIATPSPR